MKMGPLDFPKHRRTFNNNVRGLPHLRGLVSWIRVMKAVIAADGLVKDILHELNATKVINYMHSIKFQQKHNLNG